MKFQIKNRFSGEIQFEWVRVHPQDVRFIKGEPRDSTNTVVVHQQEG